jgi:hypothetical protein
MWRRAFWALVVLVSLAMPAVVQAQESYIDAYIVKVKPEKTAEFTALTKKWVAANRENNGDRWVTAETVYGEGDVYVFTSARQSYAEIDKGNESMMAAVSKAYGMEGMGKLMQDYSSCLVWSRNELRRRRWDLSRKAPADAAAFAKLIGQSRVLRTVAVHVRNGHQMEFEALLKDQKVAAEKMASTQPVLVSQAVEGNKGLVYYITTFRSSLGGFDNNPTTKDVLGEEGYRKFLQVNAEAVEEPIFTLYRFNAELSNPPDDIAAAAPDFWHPKSASK